MSVAPAAKKLPRIAITMGDPAGVGPEVCLRVLNNAEMMSLCAPLVFGDSRILHRVAKCLQIPCEAPSISLDAWKRSAQARSRPVIIDVPTLAAAHISPGKMQAATGRAGYDFVIAAIDAAIADRVVAVVTGPLNKEAMRLAGLNYPGHTEIFAEKTQATRWCMMQYSQEITCTFVTVHVGYRQAADLLTTERILEVIELTDEGLRGLRHRPPRIVVCGLNPHAGEHGLFGEGEEERIIIPAIQAAQAAGMLVEGPLPPDTAFLPAKRKTTDAFVCMYHDQGHIPVKALAFESAVNTTLGLPIIRTSVDHGTAYDIAWQGKADPSSMFAAVRLALQMSAQRK